MDSSSVLLQQPPVYPSNSIDSYSSDAPSIFRQYELMAHLERLKDFLATAPTKSSSSSDAIPISQQHPALNRFLLPSNEYVTCIHWGGHHYITGTDIVRALVFRFDAFGRPVGNMKKFEEGVFSDLRNLKPGQDACLEDPKSPFLDLLFKYQCIRTQKKQKVFYWFSVPHDRLFIDALERDLKREKIGLESTTTVTGEPALSFSYDPKRPLFEQINALTNSASASILQSRPLSSHSHAPKASLRGRAGSISLPDLKIGTLVPPRSSFELESPRSTRGDASDVLTNSQSPMSASNSPTDVTNSRGNSFFSMFSFLEGTPTYKQRRKKVKARRGGCLNASNDDDRMRYLQVHSARRSFDVAPRNLTTVAVPGRHSLDSLQGSANFLNGSTHYGYLAAQRIRVHNVPAAPSAACRPRQDIPAPAPAPEYICPLYTCRQSFCFPEELHQHMSQHTERRGAGPNGMDIDPDRQRQQVFAHTAPASNSTHSVTAFRKVSGSPEISTFSHVLTTPNGSPQYEYDYDDNSGYAPDWSQCHSHSQHLQPPVAAKIEDQEHAIPNTPILPPAPSPLSVASQPMYQHQQQQHLHQEQQQQQLYSFDSTSVASASQASTSPCYPPSSPTCPVSAPADQLTFDIPPSDTDNVPAQSRRPRSTTPPNSQPVPPRATHRRRPSTATAVLTPFGGGINATNGNYLAFGAASSSNVARSNSFTTGTLAATQQQQQQLLALPPSSWRIPPRGYHPYAAPEHGLSTRPSTSYSTSSAPSSQGSTSPFAVHLSAPGNEHGHCQSSSEGRGKYLQEHDIKYEPQEYHIVHEAKVEYDDACHIEYASQVITYEPGGVVDPTVVAAVEQVHHHHHHHHSGYIEDGGNGEYEYVSEEAHHQGYMSQELSPEVQFAHAVVPAYSEDGYEIAHASAERVPEGGNYAAHVENVYAASTEYQCVHEMSMTPEASYTSGHEQTYSMQASSHYHDQQQQQQQQHHLHNQHPHDAQMLPYYHRQQVA